MDDIIHGNIYSLKTQGSGASGGSARRGYQSLSNDNSVGDFEIFITTSGNVKVLGTLKIIITSSEN